MGSIAWLVFWSKNETKTKGESIVFQYSIKLWVSFVLNPSF